MVVPLLGELNRLSQPPTPGASDPCERPFDHPASRQNLKTFGCVGSLDDLGRQSGHGLLLPLGEDRTLIAAIRKEFLQERIASEQRLQDQHAAITVLDVGRMNQCVQQ